MFHYYKLGLLLILLVLPFVIMAWRNDFDSGRRTASRFIFAVLALWAYLLVVRFVVDAVDFSFATTREERQEIYDGDGAKNAAALLLGWAPAMILSSTAWLLIRAYRWLISRATKQA